MFKDPVCSKRINRGKAHIVIEYKGVNYFLCCPLCQAQFECAPETYARPELGQRVEKTVRQPHREHRPM